METTDVIHMITQISNFSSNLSDPTRDIVTLIFHVHAYEKNEILFYFSYYIISKYLMNS